MSFWDQIWGSLWAWGVKHFIITGWWEWFYYGVAISFACVVISYFFPILRSFCGAIVMAVVTALVTYWKAERETVALRKRLKEWEDWRDSQKW